MKQFIAYQGDEYTIEWYYDSRGRSRALNYFNDLPNERKRKVLNLFRLMATMGKIHDTTKFRSEGDEIYTFKPQPDRFLCFFFKGSKIIVTDAFEKRTQKLSPSEKERALNAHEDYINRVKKGTYYEKE